MFCPHCQAQLAQDSSTCPQCAAHISQADAPGSKAAGSRPWLDRMPPPIPSPPEDAAGGMNPLAHSAWPPAMAAAGFTSAIGALLWTFTVIYGWENNFFIMLFGLAYIQHLVASIIGALFGFVGGILMIVNSRGIAKGRRVWVLSSAFALVGTITLLACLRQTVSLFMNIMSFFEALPRSFGFLLPALVFAGAGAIGLVAADRARKSRI